MTAFRVFCTVIFGAGALASALCLELGLLIAYRLSKGDQHESWETASMLICFGAGLLALCAGAVYLAVSGPGDRTLPTPSHANTDKDAGTDTDAGDALVDGTLAVLDIAVDIFE